MPKIDLKDYFPKLPSAIERKIDKFVKMKYIKTFKYFMDFTKKCDKSVKNNFPNALKELYIGEIYHHKRIYKIHFRIEKDMCGEANGNDIFICFDSDGYSLKDYKFILHHEIYHSYKRHVYNGNYNIHKWKDYKKYACIPIEFEAESCAIGERIRSMPLIQFKKLQNNITNAELDANKKNRIALRELGYGRYIEAWEANVYLYSLFLKRVRNEVNARMNKINLKYST